LEIDTIRSGAGLWRLANGFRMVVDFGRPFFLTPLAANQGTAHVSDQNQPISREVPGDLGSVRDAIDYSDCITCVQFHFS
jgi:hypothetical protein